MRKVLHAVQMSDYPGKINEVQLFYFQYFGNYPANIELFKNNNRKTRKRCEICSKLTIKTPQRCKCRRSGISFVNFEHISQLFLVVLLLTLNK